MPLLSDTQLMAVAALLIAGIAFYTYDRLTSDDDPTISAALSTMTGSTSILFSGTHLIILLSLGVLGIFWWTGQNMGPVTIVAVAVIGIHWWVERRERQ